MAVTPERQQLADVLLPEVEEMEFASAAQLDRIERLISSRDELERYVAILIQKLEGKMYPDGKLLDRLEQLLSVLQRVQETE